MVSEKIRAMLDDTTRFPKNEVEALTAKMLIQSEAEGELLQVVYKRMNAGKHVDAEKEMAKITEAQRQVHIEFMKLHPQFKYAGQLSYGFNHVTKEPQFNSVDFEGNSAPFAEKYDLNRDSVVNDVLTYVFRLHTRVFMDGFFEFCWEPTGTEHEVTYQRHPEADETLQ
jgi:hypothetical protein